MGKWSFFPAHRPNAAQFSLSPNCGGQLTPRVDDFDLKGRITRKLSGAAAFCRVRLRVRLSILLAIIMFLYVLRSAGVFLELDRSALP